MYAVKCSGGARLFHHLIISVAECSSHGTLLMWNSAAVASGRDFSNRVPYFAFHFISACSLPLSPNFALKSSPTFLHCTPPRPPPAAPRLPLHPRMRASPVAQFRLEMVADLPPLYSPGHAVREPQVHRAAHATRLEALLDVVRTHSLATVPRQQQVILERPLHLPRPPPPRAAGGRPP